MAEFRWTPDRMEQLEHAIRERKRVALRRRGNEHIVVATSLATSTGREAFCGYLPMTGEELMFILEEVDGFEVLES